MTTYSDLIARIEQGQRITPEQLAHAKARDEYQAEKQAEQQKIADDLAAAKRKFEDHRAAKDVEHLPILTDMITELQDAHQDLVDAYPAYQDAIKAYRQVEAARQTKYRAIRNYVGEHYGHRDSIIDTTTGELHYTTYQDFMGGVVVNGDVVQQNGVTRPAFPED